MNEKQISLLVEFFISNELMKNAVYEVLAGNATGYSAGIKWGVSRSALCRQVRLMNERADMIERFLAAADESKGF